MPRANHRTCEKPGKSLIIEKNNIIVLQKAMPSPEEFKNSVFTLKAKKKVLAFTKSFPSTIKDGVNVSKLMNEVERFPKLSL